MKLLLDKHLLFWAAAGSFLLSAKLRALGKLPITNACVVATATSPTVDPLFNQYPAPVQMV